MTTAQRALTAVHEIKEARMRLFELKEAKKRNRLMRAIYYYKPHKSQEQFHKSEARIRLVLGGNRSGKSQAGAAEVVAAALGFRPWLRPEDDHYKLKRPLPVKILCVGENFQEQVRKVMVAKLLGDPEKGVPGLLPKSSIEGTKKNPMGIITFIKLGNGSEIHFQSYDQQIDVFEGTDWDYIWFDEPPPRAIWIAVFRGLTDRRGKAWFTMTPLKEPWIHEELVSNPEVEKYHFDVYDNVGYGLEKDAVDEWAAHLTPDEQLVRLHGKFFHLQGLIYPQYQAHQEIFRIDRFKVPEHYGMWMHVDSHTRTPHHALWVAASPDGRLFVCGELKADDKDNSVAVFAERIKVYEKQVLEWNGDVHRLIDPSAFVKNAVRDHCGIADEFDEHDLVFQPGSKERDAGIDLTRRRMLYKPDEGKFPSIFFFRDLLGLHRELIHYVWDDWIGKQSHNRTEKQVPRDKDDHFIEGLHRILLDRPEAPDFSYEVEIQNRTPTSTGVQSYGY